MPRITLTTFFSPDMSMSKNLLIHSFVDNVPPHFSYQFKSWDMDLLKLKHHTFYYQNRSILDQKRGAGYWLWKPFIIQQAFKSCQDGDYVLYCDAGIEIISNLQSLIDLNEDILLFNNEWKHIDWCKRDVMEAIIPGWANADRQDAQVQASVILIRNNAFTRDFVQRWLTWCERAGFIDDSPSNEPNLPGFREHRHDQAILTCLQIKHGVPLHWWPAHYQAGVRHKYPADTYPVIFNHHRKRNPGTNAIDGKGDPQPEWEEEI